MNPPSTPPPTATHHLPPPSTSPYASRPVSRHTPYPNPTPNRPAHIQAPTSSLARRRRSQAVPNSPLATSPTPAFAQLSTGMNGLSMGNGYFGFPGSMSPEREYPPTPGGFGGYGNQMNGGMNGVQVKQEGGPSYDLRALEEALTVLSLHPSSTVPSPETTIKESFTQALSALNDIRRFGAPESYQPSPSRSSTADSLSFSNLSLQSGDSSQQEGPHADEVMEAYERGLRDIETARTMLSWAMSELKREQEEWRERLK